MATTNSSTSLSRAIGPLARVKYFSRYWESTRGQRKAIYTGMMIYGGAIMIAVLAKFWGIPEVAIGLGILTDVVALAILFLLWVHLLPVSWIAGFAVGQEGGKEGPSLKDGINQGNQYVGNLAKLFARALNYGSLVFYGIALFQIERDPWKVFLFLGVSIGLFVYFTPRRSFFLEFLVIGTKLFLLIWTLISWTNLAPLQQQTYTKVSRWMNIHVLDNGADAAQRRAEDREIKAREKLALACFDELPDLPTPAQKDRCEALRRAVVPNSPVSSKDGSPAKTEERAPATPSIPLVSEWKGVYTPSTTDGRVSIGYFRQGIYCLKGKEYHEFRMQWLPKEGQEYKMTYQGKYVDHRYTTTPYIPSLHIDPNEATIPFPGEPYAYGAVFVWVGDTKVYAADGRKFHVPEGAQLWMDVNLSIHKENRRGTGGHALVVEKC